jgi:hypothetical protein
LDEKSLQDLDYPFSTQIIAEHQRKDNSLIQHEQHHTDKICISKVLTKPILSWHQTTLQLPGIQ